MAFRTRKVSEAFEKRAPGPGPFLERPGNLTGPESDFDIKVSRKVGRVLTSDEVHVVSLADNFTVQFSNLLKLSLEWKTKQINGPGNCRELRETGPSGPLSYRAFRETGPNLVSRDSRYRGAGIPIDRAETFPCNRVCRASPAH